MGPVHFKRKNWLAISNLASLIERNLSQGFNGQPPDTQVKVVKTGEDEIELYHSDLPPIEGDGAVLKILIQNKSDHEGTQYMIMGQNRLSGIDSIHVIEQLSDQPSGWSLEKLSESICLWARQARKEIQELYQKNKPPEVDVMPQPTASSRFARLTRIILK